MTRGFLLLILLPALLHAESVFNDRRTLFTPMVGEAAGLNSLSVNPGGLDNGTEREGKFIIPLLSLYGSLTPEVISDIPEVMAAIDGSSDDPEAIKSKYLENPHLATSFLYMDILNFGAKYNHFGWNFRTGLKFHTGLPESLSTEDSIFYMIDNKADSYVSGLTDLSDFYHLDLQLGLYIPVEFSAGYGTVLPWLNEAIQVGGSAHVSYMALLNEDLLKDNIDIAETIMEDPVTWALDNALILDVGMDAGVIVHAGQLFEPLSFLHFGMRVPNLIGVSSHAGKKTEYSIDLDLGVYADFQLTENLTIEGGIDMLNMLSTASGINSKRKISSRSVYTTYGENIRIMAGLKFPEESAVDKIQVQMHNGMFEVGGLFTFGNFGIGLGGGVSRYGRPSVMLSTGWGL